MNLDLKKFDYLSLVRTVLKEPNLSWFTTVFFNLGSNYNLRIRVILLLDRLGWDLKPWITNLSWLISSSRLAILQLFLILDLWYLTWLVSGKVWVVTFLTKVLTHNSTWRLNEVLLNKAISWSLPVTIFFLGLRDLATSQPVVQGSTFWYGVTLPWFLPLFLLLIFLKPTASGRLLSLNLRLESNVRKGVSDTNLRVDLINPRGSIDSNQEVGITPLIYDFTDKPLQVDENDSLRQFRPVSLQFKDIRESAASDRGTLAKEIERGYLLSHNLEPLLNSDLPPFEWREKIVQFLSNICKGYEEPNFTKLSNAELEEVISHCNQVKHRIVNQLGNLEMEKNLIEGFKVTVQWIRLEDLLHVAFPKSCSYLVNRVLSPYSKFDDNLTTKEKVRKVCEFMDLTYAEMLRTFLLGRSLARIRALLSKDHGLEYLPFISENLLFLVGNKVQEMFNLQWINLADYVYMSDLESRSEWDPGMLSLKPLKAYVDLNGVCAQLKSILYKLTGDSRFLGLTKLPDGYSWECDKLESATPVELDLCEYLPGKVMINEVQTGVLRENFWWNLKVILMSCNQTSPFIRFSTKNTLHEVDVPLFDPLTYGIFEQQQEEGLEANLNDLIGLIEEFKNVIKSKFSQREEEWKLVPILINNAGKTCLSPVLNLNLADSLESCFKYLIDENLNVNVASPWKAKVTLLEQVDLSFSTHHTLTGSSWFKYNKCNRGEGVSDEDYSLALKVFGSGDLLTAYSTSFKEFRKVSRMNQEIKKLKEKKRKIIDENREDIRDLENKANRILSPSLRGSLLDVELERRSKMIEPTEQVKSKFIRYSESLSGKTYSLLDLSRKEQSLSSLWGQQASSSASQREQGKLSSLLYLEEFDQKIEKIEDDKRELIKKIKGKMLSDSEFDPLREYLGSSSEEFKEFLELLINSWSRIGLKEHNLSLGKLRDWEIRSREFHSKEVYQLDDTEDRKHIYNLMWNLFSTFNQKDRRVISRKNGVVTFQLDFNYVRFNVSVQERCLNQVNLSQDFQPKVLRGDPREKALIPVEGRNMLLKPLFDNRFLRTSSKKDDIVSIGKVEPEVISLFKFKQPIKSSSTPLWLPGGNGNLLDLEQENLINLALTGEIDKDDLNVLRILTSQRYSKWFTTSFIQILTGKFTYNSWSKFYIAKGYRNLSVPHSIVSSYNDRNQRNVKTAGWGEDSPGFIISRKETFRNLDSIGKVLFILLNWWDELRTTLLPHLNVKSKVKLLSDEKYLMELTSFLHLKSRSEKDSDEPRLPAEMLTFLLDEKVLRFFIAFVNEDQGRWAELRNFIEGLLLDTYDRHVSFSQLIDEIDRYEPNQPTFTIARMFGADDVQLSKDKLIVTLPKDNELSFTLWLKLNKEMINTMSSLNIDVSFSHDDLKPENFDLLKHELKARVTNHNNKLIKSQERISMMLRSKDKLTIKAVFPGSKETFPNSSIRCDWKDFLNILSSKL